ncbi:Heat stress transcription factor A-1 [Apostasia shenzhenica]|uniref:Heat stress transcription factor A-1 n=1 Tax=Apostasia shenzhenica TaxID=1088818 RepID=A0A2I0ABW7_9ASPA|nr:Heat stress transcription factor A-1 [Apostasia shenzhenica]
MKELFGLENTIFNGILVGMLFVDGFRKIDPDRWEFANERFLKGQKHLLKNINRRKASHGHGQSQPPLPQSSSVASCVELGNFGLDEEIDRLKRDKNVLMQELVKLRQQQQTTDHQLQALNKRVQGMEQRQQQMMSFLAKAMNSPGFLAQFVQQSNANSQCITGGNKKRRLPNQEEFDFESASCDGQIVKYQPFMSKAADSLLMHILKSDASSSLDTLSNSDGIIQLENFSLPSETLESSRSSSSVSSTFPLSEAPVTSGLVYIPTSSGSAVCSSSISDLQSSPCLVDPGKSMLPIVPEENPQNLGFQEYPLVQGVDGMIPVEVEKFSTYPNIDLLTGGNDAKLPSIVDSFWDFLSASLLSGDTEEVESSLPEANETPKAQARWLDQGRNMDNLTEKMGLLSSNSKV